MYLIVQPGTGQYSRGRVALVIPITRKQQFWSATMKLIAGENRMAMETPTFVEPLECDPFYAGFNLSVLQDPTLQSRVCEQDLFCLVYRSRQGDRRALDLLADTFYCTLSERATGMFGREVRHVTHKEWLHAKILQFFEILLYTSIAAMRLEGRILRNCWIENPVEGYTLIRSGGPMLERHAIEATFRPEDVERVNWHELLRTVCLARDGAGRVSTLEAWMKAHRRGWRLAALPETGWEKNEARDPVILSGLEREVKRERICAELDRQGIPANLPALTIRDFQTWRDAWADPEGRMAIQRLFSKLQFRLDPVKSVRRQLFLWADDNYFSRSTTTTL
jgi:hypothetical protein